MGQQCFFPVPDPEDKPLIIPEQTIIITEETPRGTKRVSIAGFPSFPASPRPISSEQPSEAADPAGESPNGGGGVDEKELAITRDEILVTDKAILRCEEDRAENKVDGDDEGELSKGQLFLKEMEMWSYKKKLLEDKLKTVQALPATRFNKAIFRLFDDCARAYHFAAWQFKAASHTDNEEAKTLYLKAADAYLEQVVALKKDDFVNAKKHKVTADQYIAQAKRA